MHGLWQASYTPSIDARTLVQFQLLLRKQFWCVLFFLRLDHLGMFLWQRFAIMSTLMRFFPNLTHWFFKKKQWVKIHVFPFSHSHSSSSPDRRKIQMYQM